MLALRRHHVKQSTMNSATPHLLDRVQSAPLFVLSFRYRDELAAVASSAGWRVIAARRGEGAEQRFIASGAIIAVVDLRGARKAGFAAVAALAQTVEANGLALLVLGGLSTLDEALRLGATHVLNAPLTAEKFNLMVPRSRCASCGHVIAWYENIPVFSYLFLRGKCSVCAASGAKSSRRSSTTQRKSSR